MYICCSWFARECSASWSEHGTSQVGFFVIVAFERLVWDVCKCCCFYSFSIRIYVDSQFISLVYHASRGLSLCFVMFVCLFRSAFACTFAVFGKSIRIYACRERILCTKLWLLPFEIVFIRLAFSVCQIDLVLRTCCNILCLFLSHTYTHKADVCLYV